MGLFSKLFGGSPEHPPLPTDNPLNARLHDLDEPLGQLVGQVGHSIEVLPLPNAAYVFIGKPPKRFGLAWIHDGEISGFNRLVEEKGVKPVTLEKLVQQLQDAYSAAADARRYSAELAGGKVTVTDAPELTAQVDGLVRELTD